MIKRNAMVLLVSAVMLWAGSAAEYLTGFDQASRENAVIYLERCAVSVEDAIKAEALWNNGEYEKAIALVEKIERETDDISVNVTYRDPVTIHQLRWGDDVKVNAYDVDYRKAQLVKIYNGNLFIVARGDTTGSYRYKVFMSSDGGHTWVNTSSFYNSYPIYDVDVTEKPGYLYVGYAVENHPTDAHLVRYLFNGSFDTSFGTVTAFQATNNIKELKLEPNLYYQRYFYYTAVDDAGELYFFYADTSDPVTWNSISTGVTNAERGLDVDYGYYGGSGVNTFFWLSYISDGDSLCALSRTTGSWNYHNNLAAVNTAAHHTTAVAAHDDTTIVFIIETDNTIGYEITYDGGSTWNHGGSIIYTGVASSTDVTARGNEGFHICFRGFYVSGDVVFYSERDYFGAWSTPQSCNEYDPDAQCQMCIENLGFAGAYGIVYIDDNNDIYFDRTEWTYINEHKDDDALSSIVSLIPNPCSGIAKLTYSLQTTGNVDISLFDTSGRLMKNLVNETKPAGTHMISVDNTNISFGVYFIRVETADGSATKKLIVR